MDPGSLDALFVFLQSCYELSYSVFSLLGWLWLLWLYLVFSMWFSYDMDPKMMEVLDVFSRFCCGLPYVVFLFCSIKKTLVCSYLNMGYSNCCDFILFGWECMWVLG